MTSCLLEAHTVERRWAWHDITALGRHARSNDIWRGMTSPPLDNKDNWQYTVERRQAWHAIIALARETRSNVIVSCHQRLRTAHKEGRRRAWHAIISFGQHRRSDDVGRGMPSPPLDSTHGRMTSSVAFHNRPWTAHMVGRRRAWYEITALGLHAWSGYSGRGMTSPHLNSTHSRTMCGMA
uniref:Uncharacterized protein n=1 Tax=Solanum lycopersicum TaxID=4081 RepID=A0A494G8V3_SOLLC